jgi:hypothetical protein
MHVLDLVVQQIPKALPSLVVPLIQFAWKTYKQGRQDDKKKAILQRLAELATQRDAISKIPNNEDALHELDSEIKSKSDELSALKLLSEQQRDYSAVQPVARWFLLYAPKGRTPWLLHVLFFYSLAVGALLIGKIVIEPFPNYDAWLPKTALFFVSLLPALIVRNIADWVDRGRPLLATVMFWFPTICIVFWWIVLPLRPQVQIAPSLRPLVFLTACGIVMAASALGAIHSRCVLTARPLGGLRSALLLFIPSRPIGWFAIFSWYAGWTMAGVLIYQELFVLDIKIAIVRGMNFFLVGGHLVSAWRWSQSFRRC